MQPTSGAADAADLHELTSPVQTFVEGCCSIDPNGEVEYSELFRAWQRWCCTNGRDYPGTAASFGRDLKAAFPSIGSRRPRHDGQRRRLYTGIRLSHR